MRADGTASAGAGLGDISPISEPLETQGDYVGPLEGTDLLVSGSATNAGIPLSKTAPLLDVSDLSVRFPTQDGVVEAVRGVSFRMGPGEVLAVVGESGSGKSVTSLAIMGLLPKTARIEGSIKYRGVELIGMAEKQRAKLRGLELAMVFQDPMTSLNPVYRVGWQLAEAVTAHHKVSRQFARQKAIELLRLVGIPNPEERSRMYPHEFSGGMRQRVVIAMAIANDPDIIIADEPTTALDVTVQAQVLETMDAARRTAGAAMLLITHDLGVVAGVADRILVMYAGRPVEVGSVDDIFYRPRMPYTVGLLGAMPRLDSPDGGRLVPVPGAPPSLINIPAGCPFASRCPLADEVCETSEPSLVPVGQDHVAACHHVDRVSALAAVRFGANPSSELQ